MTTAHDLYRRWLPELWNSNPTAMPGLAEEIFTPDAVAHWAPGKEVFGPAAIAEQVVMATTLFEDIAVTLEHGPIVDGDLVAARWTFAGRARGGIPDFPAKGGTEVRYHGMDLLRLAGDRFAEYWPHGDNLTLMRQLGVA